MESRFLDTPIVLFELKNGIIHGSYKANAKIGITEAMEIVECRRKFFGGNSYKLILYDLGVIYIDKPARDYFTSAFGLEGQIAVAFVIKSDFTRLLVNILIRSKSKPVPTRCFTDEKLALDWLDKID